MEITGDSTNQDDKIISNSKKLTLAEKKNNDSIEFEKFNFYDNQITHGNYLHSNTNIITDFEKDRDTILIIGFLKDNISKIFTFKDFPFQYSELVKFISLIDINNDGLKDVIYQGPNGGESNMTVVFLKQNNNYLEVFRQYQDVFEIEFKDNKISKISLTNPGCCAEPAVVDYFYSVSYSHNKPIFKLETTTGYLSGFEKPNNKFSQEITFVITNENAKLRNQCYELDAVHPFYGENGNILTTYQKGSRGSAIAEKNENGELWLYVLMDNKVKFNKSDFPIFKEQPIKLYGWIKKNDTDLK